MSRTPADTTETTYGPHCTEVFSGNGSMHNAADPPAEPAHVEPEMVGLSAA
ncbi:MAG: hypothetical protein ACYTGF_02645 [Planctomycetota bacterium]|jgi:hypothetical protein